MPRMRRPSTAQPVTRFDPRPQPHNRVPDLSDLSPPELAELRGYIERLQRNGGFTPYHIRRTLSPEQIERLKDLEGRVRWAVSPAVRPVEALEVMPMPVDPSVVLKDVASDVQDAVQRISLALDLPMGEVIDPRRDPDGLHRLEQCAAHLTRIAGQIEQPARLAIGA